MRCSEVSWSRPSIKDTDPKRNQLTKAKQKPYLGWANVLERFSEQEEKGEWLTQKLMICGYWEHREHKKGALGWETCRIGNTTLGTSRETTTSPAYSADRMHFGEQCVEFGDCRLLCGMGGATSFGEMRVDSTLRKRKNTRQRKLERKEAPSLVRLFLN